MWPSAALSWLRTEPVLLALTNDARGRRPRLLLASDDVPGYEDTQGPPDDDLFLPLDVSQCAGGDEGLEVTVVGPDRVVGTTWLARVDDVVLYVAHVRMPDTPVVDGAALLGVMVERAAA